MLPTKFWADMTWPDFQSADMSRVIAVLPVAAIEQHGPHLPVGVDLVINDGYVRRAAERFRPIVRSCSCRCSRPASRASTANIRERCHYRSSARSAPGRTSATSVARAGCRKLVVMNSHGGNGAAIEAVTQELRLRWGMLAVHASWRRLGYPKGCFRRARSRMASTAATPRPR